jgi:hypothetical protein
VARAADMGGGAADGLAREVGRDQGVGREAADTLLGSSPRCAAWRSIARPRIWSPDDRTEHVVTWVAR